MYKDDYCTWFPETIFGVYIGDCCKIHDEECSTRQFFNCLKERIGTLHALWITLGGAIGCWVKYPKIMKDRL